MGYWARAEAMGERVGSKAAPEAKGRSGGVQGNGAGAEVGAEGAHAAQRLDGVVEEAGEEERGRKTGGEEGSFWAMEGMGWALPVHQLEWD